MRKNVTDHCHCPPTPANTGIEEVCRTISNYSHNTYQKVSRTVSISTNNILKRPIVFAFWPYETLISSLGHSTNATTGRVGSAHAYRPANGRSNAQQEEILHLLKTWLEYNRFVWYNPANILTESTNIFVRPYLIFSRYNFQSFQSSFGTFQNYLLYSFQTFLRKRRKI